MKIAYIDKNLGPAKLRLIEWANEIIAEYEAQGYDLTLRQLYYQFVSKGHIPNNERSYKNLGTAIDDGRMVGLIDWERIVDRTRNLEGLSHFSSPAEIMRAAVYSYHEDKWASQENHVEVWVEKQALAGVVQRICNRMDVSFFACRGYVSQSEMWSAARRLTHHRDAGQRPVILYLGDHDPSGIDMTRDVAARLTLFVGDDVEVRRLALNWDQIEEHNPPPNPAKALALDTPLPTPTGWTTIGEVQVDDRLFGSDGQICRVTAKSDIFRDKRCFAFAFAGGERIVSSEDHFWSVSARKRRGGIMTTAQIAATWVEGDRERPIYRVAVADALELPEAALPLSPYVLGVWLGDGFSSGSNIACHVSDDEIRRHIEIEGFETTRHSDTVVVAYGLRGYLVGLGVLENKHIPAAYLRASYKQRLALLQGLMDTDGTVSDASYRGGVCSFGGSRKELVYQVAELLHTLGIRARVSESRAVLNGEDYGPTWRAEFYPGDLDVFLLSRKRNRLRGARVAERQNWRTIIDVREVESVETQCIAVDSLNHLFLAGQHLIPTHNTTDARAKAYIEAHGDESWELDALPPQTINSLIEDELNGLLDFDAFEIAAAAEDKNKALLQDASKRWPDVARFLEK